MALELGVLVAIIGAAFSAGGAFAGVRFTVRALTKRVDKLETRTDEHSRLIARLVGPGR